MTIQSQLDQTEAFVADRTERYGPKEWPGVDYIRMKLMLAKLDSMVMANWEAIHASSDPTEGP